MLSEFRDRWLDSHAEALWLDTWLERCRALGVWNRTPLLAREGLEWLAEAALAGGRLRRRFGYEECVDMRFARQAVTEDPPSP